jgi:hypothetical protein
MEVRLRRWLPVLLVGLALAAAGFAAAGGSGLSGGQLPPLPEDPPPAPSAGPTAAPATAVPATGQPADFDPVEAPGWLSAALTALVFGVFGGIVLLFLVVGVQWLLTERVIRREILDQPASQPPGTATEQVRDAVRAGLADLAAGADARRAVIACWLRLERVAAAVGTAREPADTPADLVRRLLAGHRVSDRALARLAAAYRLARYAPAEVGDELLATARQALAEIDAQLAGAGGGGRRDVVAAGS